MFAGSTPTVRSTVQARVLTLLVAAWMLVGLSDVRAQTVKEKPLPAEEVTLTTSDGVTLTATYYPSRLGKEAVPLILLHALKGSRNDFESLALTLQKAGHAVIAPDLRGHGATGDVRGDLLPKDFENMIKDVETVKKFLMARNNAGELNIERLGIVGVEMGSMVAINWAAHDWSWPTLNAGKQGQDVKALVLVSPEWSFKGVRINDAVAHSDIRTNVSFLIIAGKRNSKQLQEAKRLHAALEKHRAGAAPGESEAKQTLWIKTPATSLQGTALLNEKTMKIDDMILAFVDLRLVKAPAAWRDRKGPLN